MRAESLIVEFNGLDGTPNEIEFGTAESGMTEMDVENAMTAMEPLVESGDVRSFRIYRDVTIRERELVYDSDIA